MFDPFSEHADRVFNKLFLYFLAFFVSYVGAHVVYAIQRGAF